MERSVLYCFVSFLYLANAYDQDPASLQLFNYSNTHNGYSEVQTSFGAPVSAIEFSLTVGPNGPTLLQDVTFLDTIASFDRERIPGRVVHEKGSGAFGYFKVTKDITKYTKAKVFEKVGKKTRIAIRLSQATGEKGSPETTRDPRGFAVKFYTDDGIWDLVGYNSPIFFMRDAIKQPLFAHALLRNPVTNTKDVNAMWDLMTSLPETTYMLLMLFSSKGIPDGYRHMDGFGNHAFKMVNAKGKAVYVKFHFLTDQGIKNLSPEVALNLTATNPDYATRDLYNAIAEGNFPSWTMYIQVMTFEEAERFCWNPFDVTKIWPEEDFPLIEVGKLVLTENPKNYHSDVEQAGYSPAHMVPGIEPSPDKMLQGRMFSYSDTQRHRLGANNLQLPVNRPFRNHGVTNYQKDGPMSFEDHGGAPAYFPNSFGGPHDVPSARLSSFHLSGDVKRFNSSDDDNFSQAIIYWNKLPADEKGRIVDNIVSLLSHAIPFLQKRAVEMFRNVDEKFANMLQKGLSAQQNS